MKTCPFCNSQMDDDSLFCENCGKKYPQGLVCPNCGAELNENDKFCQSCGSKVENNDSVSSSGPELIEETQKRCPNCGSIISDDSLFCENCGCKLSNEANNHEVAQQEVERKVIVEGRTQKTVRSTNQQESCLPRQNMHSSSSMMLLSIIIGVIVLALIGGGVWYYFNNKSSSDQSAIVTTDNALVSDPQSVSEESTIKARVEEIYDKMLEYKGNIYYYEPDFEKQFLSSEYNKLYDEALDLANKNDDLLMDSNPWTGQDAERPSIQVVNVDKISDNKAIVEILFKRYYNRDRTEQRTLYLVKENGIWLIDDFKEEPFYSSVKGYLKEYIEESKNTSELENKEQDFVDDIIVDKNDIDNNDDSDEVFMVVEQMPEFADGGMAGLLKYLNDAIIYPANAKANDVQGRVRVQFVINRDGSISEAQVLESVDPELDKEALRIISSMPRWKPGMKDGKVVRVRYTIPVNFRLN